MKKHETKCQLKREMVEAISVFDNYKQFGFEEDKGLPIYILGMGSSYFLPAKNAKHNANKLMLNRIIEAGFVREYIKDSILIHDNAEIFLTTNSGETREILSAAKMLLKNGKKFYAVVGKKDSNLVELCEKNNCKYQILNSGFEKSIPATKSVLEQTLFYDALVHQLAGNSLFDINTIDTLKKHAKYNLTYNLNRLFSEIFEPKKIDMVYWVGKNNGLGNELALKTIEIAGIQSKFEPETQILHGTAEVIDKNSMILIYGYEDYSLNERKDLVSLAEKTRAFMVPFEEHKTFHSLGSRVIKGHEPYTQLFSGWNFICKLAKSRGRNLDKQEKIYKYRK